MENILAVKQRFGIIGNDHELNRAVEKAIQVRLLGQVADAFFDRHIGRQLAEHRNPPLGGEQQTENDLDGRTLARTVRPQQRSEEHTSELQSH